MRRPRHITSVDRVEEIAGKVLDWVTFASKCFICGGSIEPSGYRAVIEVIAERDNGTVGFAAGIPTSCDCWPDTLPAIHPATGCWRSTASAVIADRHFAFTYSLSLLSSVLSCESRTAAKGDVFYLKSTVD